MLNLSKVVTSAETGVSFLQMSKSMGSGFHQNADDEHLQLFTRASEMKGYVLKACNKEIG
jgi:hypothetical protein